MAAIDFPTSPAVGQYFTAQGKTWVWDGTTWGIDLTSPTFVSTYAPVNNPNFTGTVNIPSAVFSGPSLYTDGTTVEGRVVSSGDTFYIQAGNSNADTSAKVNVARYSTTGTNISQFNVYADTSNFNAGTLSSTAATVLTPISINSTTTNADYLRFKLSRESTGSDWTTAAWKMQRTVDASNMGYVEFGSTSTWDVRIGSNATDIAVFAPTQINFSQPLSTQLKSPTEFVTVSATAATGVINYDAITQGVLYYTTNASANWTLNVRCNSTTALNSMITVGQSITVVFLNTNGATPYYHSALQIDGVAVTPRWVGGTAPTSGNASSIDAYSFTIIKTANATYTVLASTGKYS